MKFVPGCCNCATCSNGNARFKVFGCTPAGGSPIQIAGAPVVVKLGGTTVATVTSGSSVYVGTGAILSPGTYDVTVDFNRYDHYAGTVTIDSSCTQVDTDITLTKPSNMICCPNLGGKLVPDTLYCTDSNGTWTLVWNATLSAWVACGSQAGFSTFHWSGGCAGLTATVPYVLRIACATSGGVNFFVNWKTVQPCAGLNWTTATATCNAAGTVSQPEFDADGNANPSHYQTAAGTPTGSIVLTDIPISRTFTSLTSVSDGGGHAGVSANAPVSGPFVIAE